MSTKNTRSRTKMTEEEKKDRARWQRILRVYGITKEQYDELDLGFCPICVRNWDDRVRPCIDHDHATGDIRGLLCIWCNRRVVGRHRDPVIILRLYEYLVAERKGWIVPKRPKRKARKKKK